MREPSLTELEPFALTRDEFHAKQEDIVQTGAALDTVIAATPYTDADTLAGEQRLLANGCLVIERRVLTPAAQAREAQISADSVDPLQAAAKAAALDKLRGLGLTTTDLQALGLPTG